MEIKVMTYNIQHGLDYILRKTQQIRKIDLEKIANIIKDNNAEIVGINEIYNTSETNPDRVDQIKKLSSYTGIKYPIFAKAISSNGLNDYGNAFLSNYEILSFESFNVYSPKEHIYDAYYEDRVLLKVNLKISDKVLTCFVTHFGLAPDEQELMFNKIMEEIKKVNNPFLLMGDFNMTSDNNIIKEFKKVMNISILEDEPTFSSLEPFERIDYMFFSKDIKIIESHVIKVVQSDHFPVISTIEL